MSQKLIMHRLQKEQASLEREQIPNALVAREGFLNFHFCLHDLDGHYKGGLYHGMLELHQNYPFNAPKLFFYTPSGRFEINLPICTSFTNYHQETWTSAWNIRTLILATISFMYSQEPSYGCRTDPELIRREYARLSISHNFNNPKFVKLFGEKLVQNKLLTEEELKQYSNGKKPKSETSNYSESSSVKAHSQRGVEKKVERKVEKKVEMEEVPLQERNQFNVLAEQLNQKLVIRGQAQRPRPRRRNQITGAVVKGLVVTTLVGVGVYLVARFK